MPASRIYRRSRPVNNDSQPGAGAWRFVGRRGDVSLGRLLRSWRTGLIRTGVDYCQSNQCLRVTIVFVYAAATTPSLLRAPFVKPLIFGDSVDLLDELPLIVLTQGKLPPVDAPEARAVQRG